MFWNKKKEYEYKDDVFKILLDTKERVDLTKWINNLDVDISVSFEQSVDGHYVYIDKAIYQKYLEEKFTNSINKKWKDCDYEFLDKELKSSIDDAEYFKNKGNYYQFMTYMKRADNIYNAIIYKNKKD